MEQASSTALLIVDLQKAYFNNEALETKRAQLLEATNELIALARHNGWPVFSITTQHQKNRTTWTLNMLDDNAGYLFIDSDDSAIIDGLDVADATPIQKTRDSAFYETTLLSMLRNHSISQVVICGVSTHTCIFQTAADAYAANLRVNLATDAIATHKPEFHEMALAILQTEYRQSMQSNQELQDNIENNR